MDDKRSDDVTCDHCGRVGRCAYAENPFIAEVHDLHGEENPASWWCDECWRNCIDDI